MIPEPLLHVLYLSSVCSHVAGLISHTAFRSDHADQVGHFVLTSTESHTQSAHPFNGVGLVQLLVLISCIAISPCFHSDHAVQPQFIGTLIVLVSLLDPLQV